MTPEMALAQKEIDRVQDDEIALAVAAGFETDARDDANNKRCDWERMANNSHYRNAWAAAMLDLVYGREDWATAPTPAQQDPWQAQCAAHHDGGESSYWVEF